ncbi:hypothetical protein LF817_11365 [Halobacillus sp. A1]|uniref:hypothetical protein n=1 Tax=Halobacillus sp. A1 TaxID=2880262 RepID=UPI0020A632D5|nr:hypothetical protein [Halobacillus sp. A1]MCP3031944.1 hypothetical protein [Halobacillus sp. A1]
MENLIEVKLPGHTVFLTQDEMKLLLRSNPDVWQESIKRGKYILRSRKQKEREKTKFKGDR